MKCIKCGSTNVNVQVINETHLKNKHHSFVWWLLIGWWWKLCLWVFLTIPKLIVFLIRAIFGRKKKFVNKQKSIAVCQDCGNRWEV